ncbi:MAG: hypothetical protein ABEJ40_08735 [Haloarculaceae archaeon]
MAATGIPDGADGTDHLRAIRRVDLPPRVDRLAEAYDRQFDDRDRFLWRWIYSLFPSFTLSSVADEHAAHVREQKTILTIYVTVLDDMLEHHGDRETFREARKLHESGVEPDYGRPGVDRDALAFVERVWTAFEEGQSEAPRRDEFADAFAYDLEQTANAVEYSTVVSDNPGMATVTGARRYDSHNMVMFPYADVDLMYSPGFDRAEFSAVRGVLWDLQEMARIGNWVTTWERELAEGDYSAGVVVTALQEGVVTPAELAAATPDDREAIAERIRAHGIEDRFRRRWQELYRSVRGRDHGADTVDLDALVEGMETVYEYHLATRGLK